jgi:hypothetical protein
MNLKPLKDFLFGLLFLDLYREINEIHRQTRLLAEILVIGGLPRTSVAFHILLIKAPSLRLSVAVGDQKRGG